MTWVLILTIAILLIVVAIETTLLVLIARNEYVAISRIERSCGKRIDSQDQVDQRPLEHRN